MTFDEAMSKLWSIADKPERMRCFHKIVFEIGVNDAKKFWKHFWHIWESSENLNEDIDYFPDLVRYGRGLGSSLTGLEQGERDLLEEMPDSITVYRGSLARNQDHHVGWSWTTDKDKALWFAKRAHGSNNRVLLSSVINKEDVLAFLTGRNESEIVLDPNDLSDIESEEFTHTGSDNSAVFYAVQSGKFHGVNPEIDKMKAKMIVSTMKGPFDQQIENLEEMLKFMKWGNLTSKSGYTEEVIRLLKENPDGFSSDAPFSYQL